MSMKSNPIIMYATSETPNWKEDECKNPGDYKISDDDKKLLALYESEKSVRLLVQINSEENAKPFSTFAALLPKYKMSGMKDN